MEKKETKQSTSFKERRSEVDNVSFTKDNVAIYSFSFFNFFLVDD